MSSFCGHVADYNLPQKHGRPAHQVPFSSRVRQAGAIIAPNVASTRRRKVDYLAGVDVGEAPVPAHVDGGDPVAVHANPRSVVAHERQDGSAARMVEGHDIVRHAGPMIGIIVPTGRIRHQQAGSIPLLHTHCVGDLAVQLFGACGQPDCAGNVQTLSDEAKQVEGELRPDVVQIGARCRRRFQMDLGWWGVLEERASGMQGKVLRAGWPEKAVN